MNLIKNKNQLFDKKILIMGLGTKDGGVGSVVFAKKYTDKITVTDHNTQKELQTSIDKISNLNVKIKLGLHDKNDFLNTDIIIKNPGIKRDNPYLKIADENGVIVDSPIGIFTELHNGNYIGVTGTKGKSFTVHLLEHIFKNSGKKCIAAGNNCISPLRYIDDPEIFFILELSSWQLREIGYHNSSPNISCWLNFFPDHMNYYSNLDDYWTDKYNITKYQKNTDIIILNYNEEKFRSLKTNANKIYFSGKMIDKLSHYEGTYIEDDKIFYRNKGSSEKITNLDELKSDIQIDHNYENISAAVCCALSYGIDTDSIIKSVKTFNSLYHRYEKFLHWKKINFINDSAATTPQSVIKAIRSVKIKPIVLILCGGCYKNLNFISLLNLISNKCDKVLIFKNDSCSENVKFLMEKLGIEIKYSEVETLQEAVHFGIKYLLNRGSGTLLLSPGCSGAPFFRDLFQRGDIFKKEVKYYIKNFTKK